MCLCVIIFPNFVRSKVLERTAVSYAADRNIRLHIFGHLSKAIWWADNGKNSNIQYVDNDNSSSRLNIECQAKFNRDLSIGGIFAVELLQNSTRNTDIDNAASGNAAFTAHKAEVYFKSKSLGNVYLGKGYMESTLTMSTTDTSKTHVALDGARVRKIANNVTFVKSSTGQKSAQLSGTTTSFDVGSIFDDCDGLPRLDRIRYTSPVWEGLTVGTSHAFNVHDYVWDVAIKYEQKLKNTLLRVQVAYCEDNAVPTFNNTGLRISNIAYKQVNGSLSVLLPFGLSFMFAGAQRDWRKYKDAKNGKLWFGKVGYQRKFFEAGLTAFAIDYGNYANFVIDTSTTETVSQKHRGKTWGVGFVQFIERIATELYIVGRQYHLKVSGGDKFKPIQVIMGGARVKF